MYASTANRQPDIAREARKFDRSRRSANRLLDHRARKAQPPSVGELAAVLACCFMKRMGSVCDPDLIQYRQRTCRRSSRLRGHPTAGSRPPSAETVVPVGHQSPSGPYAFLSSIAQPSSYPRMILRGNDRSRTPRTATNNHVRPVAYSARSMKLVLCTDGLTLANVAFAAGRYRC